MSRWTHAQCWSCWYDANPEGREPARLRVPEAESCCFCGGPTTSGIYVRADPNTTLCKGDHGEEVTHMEETRSEDFAAEAEGTETEAEGTETAEEAAEAEGQDDEAGSPE